MSDINWDEYRADHVTLCSFELDEGARRVRAWAWFPAWDARAEAFAFGHAGYLRARGVGPLWLDRPNAAAVAGARAIDYLTFAQQREKAAYHERQRARELGAQQIDAERRAAARAELAHPDAPQLSIAPIAGIHVAGARVGADVFCQRCAALLVCNHVDGAPAFAPAGFGYAPGAFVERGRGWQAETIAATEPTCDLRREEAPIP